MQPLGCRWLLRSHRQSCPWLPSLSLTSPFRWVLLPEAAPWGVNPGSSELGCDVSLRGRWGGHPCRSGRSERRGSLCVRRHQGRARRPWSASSAPTMTWAASCGTWRSCRWRWLLCRACIQPSGIQMWVSSGTAHVWGSVRSWGEALGWGNREFVTLLLWWFLRALGVMQCLFFAVLELAVHKFGKLAMPRSFAGVGGLGEGVHGARGFCSLFSLPGRLLSPRSSLPFPWSRFIPSMPDSGPSTCCFPRRRSLARPTWPLWRVSGERCERGMIWGDGSRGTWWCWLRYCCVGVLQAAVEPQLLLLSCCNL